MTCWFHKWGKWAVTREGKLFDQRDPVGFFILQQRTCSVCGKKQLDLEEV